MIPKKGLCSWLENKHMPVKKAMTCLVCKRRPDTSLGSESAFIFKPTSHNYLLNPARPKLGHAENTIGQVLIGWNNSKSFLDESVYSDWFRAPR